LSRLWLLIPCIVGLWFGLQPSYRDAPEPVITATYNGVPVSVSGILPDWGDELTGFRLVSWGEKKNGVTLIRRLVTAYQAKTYGDKTMMLLPEVVYYQDGVPVIISRGQTGTIDYLGRVRIEKQRTWIQSMKVMGELFPKEKR